MSAGILSSQVMGLQWVFHMEAVRTSLKISRGGKDRGFSGIDRGLAFIKPHDPHCEVKYLNYIISWPEFEELDWKGEWPNFSGGNETQIGSVYKCILKIQLI